MAHVRFCCPITGLNVQHWLDKDVPRDENSSLYAVTCTACARIHFVDRSASEDRNETQSQR
jgi:hypothetical protein